jgi:hypothetical protein
VNRVAGRERLRKTHCLATRRSGAAQVDGHAMTPHSPDEPDVREFGSA